jgi:hypothetical protein
MINDIARPTVLYKNNTAETVKAVAELEKEMKNVKSLFEKEQKENETSIRRSRN